MFSGVINLTVYFNTSPYVAIILRPNYKVQNEMHKICHVLLTEGQRFSFLCFLIESFWQKLNVWFFGDKNIFLDKNHRFLEFHQKHYFISLIVTITEADVLVDRLDTTTTRYKMEIGPDKTKVMTTFQMASKERSR